jgi:hypothetical protein
MSGLPRLLSSTVALMFCLCCQAAPASATAPAVRSEAQLNALLASGQATPLDVLTPYGKQRFLRSLRWGSKGTTGFSFVPLVRELDPAQIDAILPFLDLAGYRSMLVDRMAGAPLRLPQPSAEVVRRLEQLEDFNQEIARQREDAASTTLGTAAVVRRYQQLFAERMGADALARQPLGDLLPLFDAAAQANFENPGSAALDELLLVHRELGRRGVDTRRTLDDNVFDALYSARRFEQARSFAAARPQLADKSVPRVADGLGPGFEGRSAYQYDAAANTLTRQALPHPAGTELVMVVSAACHFSHDALAAIGSDPTLQARLRAAKLLLVTPPVEAPRLRFVANWNAAHPTLPMWIPFDAGEWQAIDVTGVPAFYLLRDGKVIAHRKGWDGDAGKAALVGLLETAGH